MINGGTCPFQSSNSGRLPRDPSYRRAHFAPLRHQSTESRLPASTARSHCHSSSVASRGTVGDAQVLARTHESQYNVTLLDISMTATRRRLIVGMVGHGESYLAQLFISKSYLHANPKTLRGNASTPHLRLFCKLTVGEFNAVPRACLLSSPSEPA